MSKIGAHVSIAGGIFNAPGRAADLGCETFQCFTRSPQGGPAPELTEEIIGSFKSAMKQFGFEDFYIHTPYYINFASLNPVIRHSSAKVVREELDRGSILGAKYIMTHLGSHSGQTLEEGIMGVIKAVKRILDDYDGTTGLLLEISAGAGNVIGDTFDEIGEILKEVKNLPGMAGVCFDTCHAFASGYDFRKQKGTEDVIKEFDEKIGLKWLKLAHVNDSKFALGEHRDRHEHIGKGHVGEEGIMKLLRTEPFGKIDWILETEDEGREKDVAVLKKFRLLQKS